MIYVSDSSGQCPAVGFSAPDTVCSGVPVSIANNPVPGVNYQWNFCPGQLLTTPDGINPGTDPNLSFTQQLKLVRQNGNYFLFVLNFFGGNSLCRYDYGNSLDNTPTFYNYGAIGGLNQPIGIDIVEEAGNYHALIANYASNHLVEIDFGNDIALNSATATDLGVFPFAGPRSVRIVYDGSNYFAFVTNDAGSDIIRIDFGNSITNTPSGSTAINNAAFSFTYGIDIQYDCDLSSWIGYVASFNLGQIQVLNFGSSPGNSPLVTTNFATFGNPSGLRIVRDGMDWHALVISNSGAKLQDFKVGGNLLNTPVQVFLDTIGSMNNPREITVLDDSASFSCFISNAAGSLSRIKWNSGCTPSQAYSNSPTGVMPVFDNPGMHYITLAATGANGITSYYSDSIYVNETPSSGFTNSLICDGAPVQFTDVTTITSGTITSWSWNFGDGSLPETIQNPVHSFMGAGNSNVTLTVTSDAGCVDSVTVPVLINPLPTAAFTFPNNECAGTPVLFTDNSTVTGSSTITGWNWDFGDGSTPILLQNPVHAFDSGGVYTVTLITEASSGCTDTLNQSITLRLTPETAFTVSETCSGAVASFANQTVIGGGIGLSYNWNFGDNTTSNTTSPGHQYPASSATYSVQLIANAANGCSDTLIQDVTISNQPIPAFTWSPLIVCMGNAVSFFSTSSGVGGDTISQFLWDFGDLTYSQLENPMHAFADTGNFQVTLTVVSPTYCDSSITQQVYVIPSPTASFTAGFVCLGNPVQFNPLISTPVGTSVDSVAWTFGDGATYSGLTSPSHNYQNPGTYSVTMTVYNNLLCTGTYSDSVTVYPLPVADFTSTLGCSGSAIQFDGTVSSVLNDNITGWLWNFGNLGTATDSVPLFTFADSGSYAVTLITTTQHGCSDTIINQIYVIASPDFDFSYTEPCFGNAAVFSYSDNVNPPQPANLLWDFGDGNQSSMLNPLHLYGTVDTFNVGLLVLNPNTGCSKQLFKNLIIKPVPLPSVTVSGNCQNTPVQFTDNSTIQSGSITSWQWNLGNGTTSALQNPQTNYGTSGTYSVSATMTSALGCSSDTTLQITIHPQPVTSFVSNPIYGSPPLTVNFTNNSTGAVQYLWNFGDGFSDSTELPVHIFTDTGTYVVTLYSTSSQGCIGSFSGVVSVLVPFMDIAVSKVYYAVNGNQLSISAKVENRGNLTVNSFQIAALIDDATPIAENWSGTLAPGNSLLYEFNASYILQNGSVTKYVCASTSEPNGISDDNPANDKNCAVTNQEYEVFSAFPGPFHDEVTIAFNLPLSGPVDIEMYDDIGKRVLQKTNIPGYTGFNTIQLNTINLSRGFYSIVVRFRDNPQVIKSLKQ
ncbi:MAG TPA: PKD domain-containing protein [Bacteroidia bacterium]|nr:PKD domain-containing protein [Bacteroidia bacterium]